MNIGILIPGFSATETDWSIPVYQNLVRELARDHFVRVFPLRYPFTREPYEVFGAEVFPFNGGSDTAGLGRWRMLWNVEQVVKEEGQAEGGPVEQEGGGKGGSSNEDRESMGLLKAAESLGGGRHGEPRYGRIRGPVGRRRDG